MNQVNCPVCGNKCIKAGKPHVRFLGGAHLAKGASTRPGTKLMGFYGQQGSMAYKV